MGCSGSKAADAPVEINRFSSGKLEGYSTSVDDKGSAVTAGFVRQAQERRRHPKPNTHPPQTLARSPHRMDARRGWPMLSAATHELTLTLTLRLTLTR